MGDTAPDRWRNVRDDIVQIGGMSLALHSLLTPEQRTVRVLPPWLIPAALPMRSWARLMLYAVKLKDCYK